MTNTDAKIMREAGSERPWVKWLGGDCPIQPNALVRFETNGGMSFPRSAWAHDWHKPCEYRVVTFGEAP